MTLPLLLAARLLLGEADAGYVRERTSDGAHCLRWPVQAGASSAISFVQSSAGDFQLGPGLFDAVSRSEASWASQASACSSLVLLEGTRSPSRSVGYVQSGPNENLVLVRTTDCSRVVGADEPCRTSHTCGNLHDCWDHGASLLAVTLLTYDANGGALLDADVEINGAISYLSLVDSPPCTPGNVTPSCVGNDVQAIVTHELGHALGLDHSPDPSSTMYAVAPLGETSKRILDPASKQFLCDVYPPGLASRDCSLPDGGTEPTADAGDPGGGGPSVGPGPGGPGIARTAGSCASAGGHGAPGMALVCALVAAAASRRKSLR